MLAPPEARAWYTTKEYKHQLETVTIPAIRAKLDSGLGDEIFEKYRAKEGEMGGKYRVILVGALMIRAGAQIKPDDFQHLRDLVPMIHCSEVYAMAHCDDGFRGPGKAQFLAALDHYQPGTPRRFSEPSCFQCGKIHADVGKALKRCGQCKEAWYCEKDCQKTHWKHHRSSCAPPECYPILNV
ncbi:hypothetical protein GQ53DRAFT_650879 [Thozetella sp. PMI_491]|nr:hypothetical protein GQ53DRAFT_650879 [Thozetella sp. PMI_491]